MRVRVVVALCLAVLVYILCIQGKKEECHCTECRMNFVVGVGIVSEWKQGKREI